MNGMLGGYYHVNDVGVQSSEAFLKTLFSEWFVWKAYVFGYAQGIQLLLCSTLRLHSRSREIWCYMDSIVYWAACRQQFHFIL
ncbi:hypothetical protein VitviT2T_005114 [Vitis vinifera]|uniref:Uncharacterized protein n=1 Tax=Vitis vinifera TaxID=29760 RepID=A0ABY9BRL3_VITVI|nr:hypothetical protein VitviT2T_005114 [Vitis vinifera]